MCRGMVWELSLESQSLAALNSSSSGSSALRAAARLEANRLTGNWPTRHTARGKRHGEGARSATVEIIPAMGAQWL